MEWNEKTTRNGKMETFTGLIYIGRPYLTAVDVTERRNIMYSFRSLLKRDQKGSLIAGIYFKVANNWDEFTIFFQDMGKQRVKMNFSAFTKTEVGPYYQSFYYVVWFCHIRNDIYECAPVGEELCLRFPSEQLVIVHKIHCIFCRGRLG